MSVLKQAVVAAIVFVLMSALLFGGPLRAVFLAVVWRDGLGLENRPWLMTVGVFFGVLAVVIVRRVRALKSSGPVAFVVVAMTASSALVGLSAEWEREAIISTLDLDLEMRSSIFASFRNAPRDFQFFLHGMAMKDCVPLAWSWREMGFYELPAEVAVNVLPASWLADCGFPRSD